MALSHGRGEAHPPEAAREIPGHTRVVNGDLLDSNIHRFIGHNAHASGRSHAFIDLRAMAQQEDLRHRGGIGGGSYSQIRECSLIVRESCGTMLGVRTFD